MRPTLLLHATLACAAAPEAGPAAVAAESLPAPEVVATPPLPPALPGCRERVEDLPVDPLLALDDPRLRGTAVIVVLKEARRLMLFGDGALRRTDRPGGAPSCWPVALGVGEDGHYPPGTKVQQGDSRTPEGWYRTSDRPWSSFRGAISIHYPNAADARRGLAAGHITPAVHDAILAADRGGRLPPQETALGGAILIHGGGSSVDWTLGCVALADDHLDELRAALPGGMRTDVLILP